MEEFVAFGAAEKVTVVDKEGVERSIGVLDEKSLSIVDVFGADIEQPGEPEALAIANSLVTFFREDFEEAELARSEELGSDTKAGLGPDAALGGVCPAIGVFIEEIGGQEQGPADGRSEAAGAIELSADAFIEGQVGFDEAVREFGDVEQSVVGLNQVRMRIAGERPNVPGNQSKVISQGWHESSSAEQLGSNDLPQASG